MTRASVTRQFRACHLAWLLIFLFSLNRWALAAPEVAASELIVVADGIPATLTPEPGDASRGRTIVASRQLGLCFLCHSGPIPEERFQGNLAPDLSGVGGRWTAAQLRLRLVDPSRINTHSIMPAYYQTSGLNRVASAWRDRPLLSAQQIEDVVAYLVTLRQ